MTGWGGRLFRVFFYLAFLFHSNLTGILAYLGGGGLPWVNNHFSVSGFEGNASNLVGIEVAIQFFFFFFFFFF